MTSTTMPIENSKSSEMADSDLVSPSDSVIADDFGSLSVEMQEKQRQEWKEDLAKTEEEIHTLKQVLASKEVHAAGLKRRLGITAWREFSDDMQQGLKNLQDSEAFKKTAEGMAAVKSKTASAWSSISTSTTFHNMTEKVGSAFGAAKNKVSTTFSSHNINQSATKYESLDANGDAEKTVEKI